MNKTKQFFGRFNKKLKKKKRYCDLSMPLRLLSSNDPEKEAF